MSAVYDTLDGHIADFIARQPMFFVATAASEGHVNVSPKGGTGTLKVLGSHRVAYLDLTGSGAETIAHVTRLNRITLMWCAFEGTANIVRVYGTARVIPFGHAEWDEWYAHFAEHPGARSVIVVDVERISDSCGFAVPLMSYEQDRDALDRHNAGRDDAATRDYWVRKNSYSIDGFPGLQPVEDDRGAPQ